MIEYATEIGLGGLFALFLVREFLNYTSASQKKKSNCSEDPRYRELLQKVDRLYEMHKVYDQDGAPIWYRKRMVEDKINKIYHSIGNLQQALLAIHEALRKISEAK